MISPDLYVSLVKPRQRRLFEAIKRKTDAKLFYHGCGAVFDLVPHLIEIGVDILNPVQVSARGMDSKRLKATYGKDITFWGGGVDTQRVLPFGTADEVRDEVRRRIDDFAPGGGFVFATVHNIQAFVPPENIVAVYDTVSEHGAYGGSRAADDGSSTGDAGSPAG
jgi:uroporphyrinogen decarboxylase